MTIIIMSVMGFAVLFGAYSFAHSVLHVIREQFEELMPERMVDLAGFVEVPK